MTDKKKLEEKLTTDQSNNPRNRRRVVKTLAASGGLMATGKVVTDWKGPIVDSVLLPAHAQTSPTEDVYELSCAVLWAQDASDFTAISGENVELGLFFGGAGAIFSVNQMEAALLLNGEPVEGADICMTVTETMGHSDVDIDVGTFSGGDVHTEQTSASGEVSVSGLGGWPFNVDEDSPGGSEDFNVQFLFYECDNPDVPECAINFSGATETD